MDYLDPKKKKAHRTRLFIGYALMAIAISFATVILVYVGSGYNVDRQTGDLIQNGQILVASQPEGAEIYVNEKEQRAKTTGKLVLPSGAYTISVRKNGYRTWNKSVALDGGSIQRLDYVLLVPQKLTPTITQTYVEAPTQMTQSVDRRYVSLLFTSRQNTLFFYDLVKPDLPASEVNVPQTVLKNPTIAAAFKVIEWSEDNKHVLLANTDPQGTITDYVLASRDPNEAPVNLSQRYGLTTQTISLLHKKKDAFFIHDAINRTLFTVQLNEAVPQLRLSDVIQYKAYDENTILYVTTGSTPEKVAIKMTEASASYVLREVVVNSGYVFDVAKQGATFVVAAGSMKENKVAVYRNPLGYLKADKSRVLPLATTIFQLEAPSTVHFSTDNSVVMVRGTNAIATHYFEEDKTTRFENPVALTQGAYVAWADGKHISVVSGGKALLMDYDGTNVQQLGEANEAFGILFDTNYRNFYTTSNIQRPFNITKVSFVVQE